MTRRGFLSWVAAILGGWLGLRRKAKAGNLCVSQIGSGASESTCQAVDIDRVLFSDPVSLNRHCYLTEDGNYYVMHVQKNGSRQVVRDSSGESVGSPVILQR